MAKSAAGLVATDSVHITKPVNGKRRHDAISTSGGGGGGGGDAHPSLPETNRDGRNKGDEAALRPARNFAKFVDYNMSSMTDTKGGFLSAEDDPHSYASSGGGGGGGPDSAAAAASDARPAHMTAEEWERMQIIRSLRRNRTGPFEPGISVLDDPRSRKRCRECSSPEVDWVWDDVFGVSVCNRCKDKFPEKYSLLTKTECKEDYLLTDRTYHHVLCFFFLFFFGPPASFYSRP